MRHPSTSIWHGSTPRATAVQSYQIDLGNFAFEMQQPDKIDRIVRELLEEARRDYIGLWHIATIVRREFGFIEGDEVRTEALLIVARLLEGGLWPGDYSRGGFQFWAQKDVDAVLARIGGEWVTDNGDPSLEKPICWFAARSDQA